MNVCGIVVAHNEDWIIQHTIDRLDIPYIAVLDNPTDTVRQATQSAWAVLEAPKQSGSHVYYWQHILDLIKRAALLAKAKRFDWVIRIDADEDWHDAIAEIIRADATGKNIVNYRITQYEPTAERSSLFSHDTQRKTTPESEIHLEPDGNFYHRAWKLDTDKFNIGAGGHVILRHGDKVYESSYHFKHYPAADLYSLRQKAKRRYSAAERQKGWHIQYDGLKTEDPQKPVTVSGILPAFHIFFHVALMGCWRDVLEEQVKQLNESGILNHCKTATAICVGAENRLPDMPSPFNVLYGGALDNYEFPTLAALAEKAACNPDDAFLYLHTKGVSKPASRRRLDTEWRRYMMWATVENWLECLQAMQAKDAAGVEWYADLFPTRQGGSESNHCHGFFAGTFWWATGRHINSLPHINCLDRQNRWQAEAWIGLGNKPKIHEVMTIHCHERQGMFPPGFCRESYIHRSNRVLVNVSIRPSHRRNFHNKIIDAVGESAVVYIRGLKQSYLRRHNFFAVQTEPEIIHRTLEM